MLFSSGSLFSVSKFFRKKSVKLECRARIHCFKLLNPCHYLEKLRSYAQSTSLGMLFSNPKSHNFKNVGVRPQSQNLVSAPYGIKDFVEWRKQIRMKKMVLGKNKLTNFKNPQNWKPIQTKHFQGCKTRSASIEKLFKVQNQKLLCLVGSCIWIKFRALWWKPKRSLWSCWF